jgi:hypothetical protein
VTTYIPFVPSPTQAFEASVTLDGQPYLIIVTWNAFGQRWYFNLLTIQGELILSCAMVGSPPRVGINLTAGYFQTSSVVFRQSTQQFEISP